MTVNHEGTADQSQSHLTAADDPEMTADTSVQHVRRPFLPLCPYLPPPLPREKTFTSFIKRGGS